MNVPRIGILAGMGPRSTAPFVDLVVTECQRQYGARDDIDFPPMIISSLPTPFYLDRPLDHEALAASIEDGVRHLAGTGVAFIAMPCNSAHRYFPRLARASAVPLLNMTTLALEAMPAGAGRIALLATRSTVESDLYQPAIAAAGRSCFHTGSLQQQVDALITAIKAGPPAEARAGWQATVDLLAESGVDAALVACTDLNAVLGTAPAPFALVDATRQLAVATVRTWLGLRRAA